ncbi:MAG: hypothetical protein J1E41_00775 [Ruminococcus sp.]|nr:hypothetical protein [Ruminococcus sp.]
MKKTISIFLSLLFILTLATPASALCLSGSNIFNCSGGNCTSGDFSYCLNGDGTACLTGYNGSCPNIKLPSSINGCKVTSVASCFSDSSNCNLNNVTIPSCVKSIGCNAFSDCTLNSDKGSCAEQYAKSDCTTNFKSVSCGEKSEPKLSQNSVCVKKGKTCTVSIIGKKSGIKNKCTNSSCAKIISKNSSSKLTVKGLKKGTTTLKIKVNNSKTLKLKVKVK